MSMPTPTYPGAIENKEPEQANPGESKTISRNRGAERKPKTGDAEIQEARYP